MIDFEQEADDLNGGAIPVSMTFDEYTVKWLRGFAARVMRDAVEDNGKGWNLPEVKKLFDDWLERRAKGMEQ